MKRWLRYASIGCAAAASVYGAYVVYAWRRYGHPGPPAWWNHDELLDRFIPVYDVVERHHALVNGPADAVLRAACEQRLTRLPLVRTIFKARELILRAAPDSTDRSRGLLEQTTALGWVVLAEIPGREVVVGAVTKPWEANVTFRGIPPQSFAAFAEPGYVKIVWTLRTTPAGPGRSVFRTETRALATDAFARAKFRRYWAFLSPGIIAIRWLAAADLRRSAGRARVAVRERTDAWEPNFESAIRDR